MFSADTAAIDVLISFVDNEWIVLPSGLFLLSSKFGYLLTGKFVDPNCCMLNMLDCCV